MTRGGGGIVGNDPQSAAVEVDFRALGKDTSSRYVDRGHGGVNGSGDRAGSDVAQSDVDVRG